MSMKITAILAILVGCGFMFARQPRQSEPVTCEVTEKVNPVSPEFELACNCHTLWTVVCDTRNRHCKDDSVGPNCVKTILDIPNSKFPHAWEQGEYLGAKLIARWDDRELIAVSVVPRKRSQ